VTKPGTSTAITEGKVDLIIKTDDSTSLLSVASVTDKGEFAVDNLHFKKAASVAYQGTNSKKEKLVVEVALYPQYLDTLQKVAENKDAFPFGPSPASKLNTAYIAGKVKYADSISKSDYLSNVTVKATKLSPVDSLSKLYTSGLFQFGGRKLASNNAGYFSIWQLIRTVPGFVIEGDMKNPSVTLARTAGLNVFSDNTSSAATFSDGEGNAPIGTSANYVENGIAFFLNEIPVSRDALDNISMSDVAFVKTYVGAESSAIGPYNGVVAVYTNKGVGAGSSILDKSFVKTRVSGYSITREFFAPDYELNPAQRALPDDRITLMWKPTLQFDANGKASIKFFNNDVAKKIKILIQGIDADGRLIFKEQIIE
ncbi:MAG TPA: hypothetical protein VM935_04775, partial [Chitinophagaceae bacterium]|nr:hypothetical protein [Chitinophagaceae bacterium]